MDDAMAEELQDRTIYGSDGSAIGAIDVISGDPLPIVRVFGWAKDALPALAMRTSVQPALTPLNVFRMERPDVVAAGAATDLHCGFRADFFVERGETPVALTAGSGAEMEVPNASAYGSVRPHYETLLKETRVLRRNDIYGFGPPTDVSITVKNLMTAVQGKVLDFGCGNGDLLLTLREQGCDAWGVELDSERIHLALKPEAKPFARLYGGGVPLPFDDGSFDWIVTSEVIEHIEDIEIYVSELARLLRADGRLFVTTPDISCIPSSYPTATVPWHLLESTHVRFFTPTSLRALLEPFFRETTAYSIGDTRVNGWFIPGSIAAVFRKV